MKQITITKTYAYFGEEDLKNFKKWLIEKGLTFGEVADKVDISWTYLSLIINGKRPLTKKFKDKLEALGYEM